MDTQRPSDRTPSEAELHSLADGQLEAGREAAVRAWLAQHPETAAEVARWQHDSALLRALHSLPPASAPSAHEQLPWRRSITPAHLPRAVFGSGPWQHAAAVLILIGTLGAGGAGGWMARGWRPSAPAAESAAGSGMLRTSLAGAARAAHAVYAPEVRHPVEVGAAQEAHLVAWLSKRLKAPLQIPRLAPQGFDLLGGRLLAEPDSGQPAGMPMAQFMYENAQRQRLTLLIRVAEQPASSTTPRAAFEFVGGNGLSTFYWLDHGFGYALTADLPREQLLAVAESVHRQLTR